MEGLRHCDTIIKASILALKRELDDVQNEIFACEYGHLKCGLAIGVVNRILEKTELCCRHSLPNSTKVSLLILNTILNQHMVFFNSTESVQKLVLMLEDETFRNYLLPTLMTKLPDSIIPKTDPEELVECPFFPCAILQAAMLDRSIYLDSRL